MSKPVVHCEMHGEVAVITLDRPEAKNAINRQLSRELRSVVAQCEAEEAVRAMVLTGTGNVFCAGLDLKEVAAGTGMADLRTKKVSNKSVTEASKGGLLSNRKKPLIGAVNGAAVTGGLELALNCDFLIASDNASFADTHARVGIMPGWGLTVLLPQCVGLPRARQMSITGNYVFARQALEWGLVNEVVPAAYLLNRAVELARSICQIEPRAVQHMLQTYEATVNSTLALEEELRLKQLYKESTGALVAERFEGIRKRGANQQNSNL